MQPHGLQPTRLPRPWDSPGKNIGVGHHFLLQCTKVKSESEAAESYLTLRDPMDCSLPGSSIHGIFQARILEWVATSLLQGIFPTQGSNPCLLCLLHCRQILYPLSRQRSPSKMSLDTARYPLGGKSLLIENHYHNYSWKLIHFFKKLICTRLR